MKPVRSKSAFEKKPGSLKETSSASENQSSIKKNGIMKSFSWSKIIMVTVVLLGVGSAIYYYLQYQNTQKLLQDPSLATEQEVEKLIEKIGRIVELPRGEVPTIATVSDVSALSGNVFFKNAKTGDKVLIYSNARKAVLYRPATNKIIELGPINIPEREVVSATPSAEVVSPLRVAIYNGTGVAGLAATTEESLDEKKYIVITTDNASKSDYDKTLIVDLKGNLKTQAEELAKVLNGEVGDLPQGEQRVEDADFVVILGGKL